MPTPLSRRRFLSNTAAAAGAALSVQSLHLPTSFAAEKDMPMTDDQIPIVDTHQHLWDLSKFRLPWHEGESAAPLRRSFVMSDYLQATKGLNVVKTVYMEVDVDPVQQVQEAEYVLDLCRRDDNPMAAAVISGRPNSKEFKSYIERFAGNKYIKGIRQVLHGTSTPAGYCLQPEFVEGIKLLGEMGLSFDLCMRPDELLDAVRLVDQCPKTRFIVDHCGNMSVQSTDEKLRSTWMKGMQELAKRDHTVCKVSGIIVTAKKGDWQPSDLAPNMNFTMETFGEDRCLFAGDWPVCTLVASLSEWVNALQWIVRDRSPAFKRKLFHDNAVKFYGLS